MACLTELLHIQEIQLYHKPKRWKNPEALAENFGFSMLQKKMPYDNSIHVYRWNQKFQQYCTASYYKKTWTYFGEACGVPFSVDLVSDAKCHERVFAGGVPRHRIYIPISNMLFTYEKITTVRTNAKNTMRDKISPHHTPEDWKRVLVWNEFCFASICMCGLKCTFLLTESSLQC